MWQQGLYSPYGWKMEAGYYRLLLPVPGTNRQIWSEQIRHLTTSGTAWQVAPICIAATAMLVHLIETGSDPLSGNWCRCAGALPGELRVGLAVHKGRVGVYNLWDGYRYKGLCLAGCGKC